VLARGMLCAILLASVECATAGSLDALKSFVAATSSAQGEFQQNVYDRNHKLVQASSGKLAFSRPGRFRWTYVKPYPQLIVGDGARVWIYDEDLKQVTVRRLDRALGSTPAALLAGSNEIDQAFKLSDQGEKNGLEWVEAIARTNDSSFEKIRMGFGFSGLERMELADNFGQTTVLKFTTFSRNPRLDPALFKFVPPKGADVIGE
jgi:outer membrane lipoprotein carrier protein